MLCGELLNGGFVSAGALPALPSGLLGLWLPGCLRATSPRLRTSPYLPLLAELLATGQLDIRDCLMDLAKRNLQTRGTTNGVVADLDFDLHADDIDENVFLGPPLQSTKIWEYVVRLSLGRVEKKVRDAGKRSSSSSAELGRGLDRGALKGPKTLRHVYYEVVFVERTVDHPLVHATNHVIVFQLASYEEPVLTLILHQTTIVCPIFALSVEENKGTALPVVIHDEVVKHLYVESVGMPLSCPKGSSLPLRPDASCWTLSSAIPNIAKLSHNF
ncbi:hypothetical protein M0802_002038 [Mischocyttarus mexicanus]|nr:hypothetical protein M0802_002038 [Mischocyttarus mexicanus]